MDVAIFANGNQDIATFPMFCSGCIGTDNFNPGFLDKGSGDNKKYKQVKNEVQHGCQVYAMVLAFILTKTM
jgi:hypothetical protein